LHQCPRFYRKVFITITSNLWKNYIFRKHATFNITFYYIDTDIYARFY
jgi:hypothetical protein